MIDFKEFMDDDLRPGEFYAFHIRKNSPFSIDPAVIEIYADGGFRPLV